MTTPTASAKRRLAETLLDGGFLAYVARRREARQSWRVISLAIREDVNLDLHPHTIRAWFIEEQAEASPKVGAA